MSPAGIAADALVAAIVNNKQVVIDFISSGEAAVSGEIKQLIQALPKPGGILGIFFPALEAGFMNEVDAIINKLDPEALFGILVTAAQNEAKALGG